MKQSTATAPAKTTVLSHEDFCKKAIVALRKGEYKGIHTVYSGFNAAFKEYFPGQDPVEVTKALVASGKLASHFARGGVMIYLPEDKPAKSADASGKKALASILG